MASLRNASRRILHTFPTRRSSDLGSGGLSSVHGLTKYAVQIKANPVKLLHHHTDMMPAAVIRYGDRRDKIRGPERSEEHTSELQSQSKLVCRLLREKKNATLMTIA